MKKVKTLASCNDLGGANQLIHSIKGDEVIYLLTGPASRVAEILGLSNLSSDHSLDLSDFSKLIVASNSQFQLSDKLLIDAKNLGLKTEGYLDHWVNYRTRWSTTPDKVIVTDLFAFVNAFFAFGFRVRFRHNYYLRYMREQSRLGLYKVNLNQALFLIQPFLEGYKHEDNAKTCYCKFIELFIDKYRIRQVLIRDHTTTNSTGCVVSLRRKRKNVVFSSSDWTQPLEADIFESEFVVGYDTYALYLAKKLGKNVYTIGNRRVWFSPRYRRI